MQPIFSRNAVTWVYQADEHFSWNSEVPVGRDHYFRDQGGTVRLIIGSEGRITVTRGYAWNGCTPKIVVLDQLIGTPDGAVHKSTGRPKTYFATMVHDALYQFLRAESPYSRRQADRFFLQLMGESEFVLRHVYWIAVRALGWISWSGKRIARNWRGVGVVVEGTAP